MNEVEEAVDRLANALLNSDVYLEYKSKLEQVKKDPELKRQIDEFRMRNYELQQSPDYAFDKVEFSPWLTELRNEILNETIAKIEKGE